MKQWIAGCAMVLGFSASAFAKEQMIDAVPFEGKKVRIDGMLREWPKLVALGQNVSGRGGKDPKAEGLVAYDDDYLYVAMRVTDAKFTRSKAFGDSEDYASLKLAFPERGGSYKTYQVRLYPGQPGQSAGTVKVTGLGKVPGAKIIEMPTDDGLSFEASIPWKVFPQAARVRSGLRGALLYHDSDGGKVSCVIGTSAKSGSELPMLTIEAEYAMHQSLVFAKGLDARPSREVYGDLVGSDTLERVAVYERYLTVTGWGFRKGREFFYQDLNLTSAGDLQQIAAVDFDRDGKDELFLVRKLGSAGRARIYAEVWKFPSETGAPKLLFQHEVGMVEGQARIQNEVSLSSKGKTPSITVSQGSYDKVVPEEWTAPAAGEETYPTVMPWEPVASRRYEWKDDAFQLVDEKAGKAKLGKPKRGTRSFTGTRPSSEDPVASAGAAPPPPRPPSGSELMDQVYNLYRRDQRVKAGKPRFDFVTDVAGDDTAERVLVHGSDLVVFGQRFKEGTSYVYTKIGVKSPEHILDVTARDVTGDGKADIIVRAVLPAQASESLGGKVVTRHALFIYKIQQHAITRVFAAETGRSLDDDMILGLVRFTPVGTGVEIELLPGRAVGWTQKTYPFPEDKTPYGGLEPLLLPWTEMQPRRYTYQGAEFKQK